MYIICNISETWFIRVQYKDYNMQEFIVSSFLYDFRIVNHPEKLELLVTFFSLSVRQDTWSCTPHPHHVMDLRLKWNSKKWSAILANYILDLLRGKGATRRSPMCKLLATSMGSSSSDCRLQLGKHVRLWERAAHVVTSPSSIHLLVISNMAVNSNEKLIYQSTHSNIIYWQ